jgi:DivIVA domain-containing protein
MKMLPPNELKNKGFSKAVRGYSMAEVDEHIEFIIEKYTELYRENDDLERKLRVTLAKLEAIKKDEESIRSALINAQRASSTIINEANERADIVMRATKTNCDKILSDFRTDIRAERDRMLKLRTVVAKFKTDLFNIYNTHIEYIENINPEPEGFEDITITEETFVKRAISEIKKDVIENIEQFTAKDTVVNQESEQLKVKVPISGQIAPPSALTETAKSSHPAVQDEKQVGKVSESEPEETETEDESDYEEESESEEESEPEDAKPAEEPKPAPKAPAFVRGPVTAPRNTQRKGSVKDTIRELNKVFLSDKDDSDDDYKEEADFDGTQDDNNSEDDDFGADEFDGFKPTENISAPKTQDNTDSEKEPDDSDAPADGEEQEDKEYREFIRSIDNAAGSRQNIKTSKKQKKNKPKPVSKDGSEFDFI